MEEKLTEVTLRNGLTIKVGEKYIVDAEFNNRNKVELIAIYGKLFCRVKAEDGYEWELMSNRLSYITKNI